MLSVLTEQAVSYPVLPVDRNDHITEILVETSRGGPLGIPDKQLGTEPDMELGMEPWNLSEMLTHLVIIPIQPLSNQIITTGPILLTRNVHILSRTAKAEKALTR